MTFCGQTRQSKDCMHAEIITAMNQERMTSWPLFILHLIGLWTKACGDRAQVGTLHSVH